MRNISRILDMRLPHKQSAFLWGARKTGKTTYLKEKLPNSLVYDFLKTDLFLEFSKNPSLFMNSTRPPYLKHRIKSRHGHLSNEQAMDALHELITQDTKIVMLGHLSNECNKHSIVEDLASKKLKHLGRADIKLYLMKQETPLNPVLVG